MTCGFQSIHIGFSVLCLEIMFSDSVKQNIMEEMAAMDQIGGTTGANWNTNVLLVLMLIARYHEVFQ